MSDKNDDELQWRFTEQAAGRAKREYPDGQINADDEGELLIRMRVIPEDKVIVIDFGKAVTWIGLDIKSAESIRDNLDMRIKELRGL